MSSTRSRKRKRIHSRSSSEKKNNGVLVYKIIDPLLQGVLIVAFICCDGNGSFYDFHYLQIIYTLIGLQIFSSIINLFFRKGKYVFIINERIYFLILVSLYMVFYSSKDFTHNAALPFGFGINPPLYSVLNIVIIGFAFWYNVICFRELKVINERSLARSS